MLTNEHEGDIILYYMGHIVAIPTCIKKYQSKVKLVEPNLFPFPFPVKISEDYSFE